MVTFFVFALNVSMGYVAALSRLCKTMQSSCLIYLFGEGGAGFGVGLGCGGLLPLLPPDGFPVVLGALVGLCLLMIFEFYFANYILVNKEATSSICFFAVFNTSCVFSSGSEAISVNIL